MEMGGRSDETVISQSFFSLTMEMGKLGALLIFHKKDLIILWLQSFLKPLLVSWLQIAQKLYVWIRHRGQISSQ